MRKISLFVVAAFVLLGVSLQADEPRLIVAISIDQMRYEYLETFASQFEGGFKTLLSKGAVFSKAYYRHANTETGPGHAVLLSGMHGSHSGIIANGWYDSWLKKFVNVVDDPLVEAVGGKGRAASPANFIGFTLGDALKLRLPQTRVVGVSAKDRAAILMAGKKADAAYWFERGDGKFITSSYYMTKAPTWLDEWNASGNATRYLVGEWKVGASTHPLATNDDLLKTPFADDMTAALAVRAMKEHHLGEGPSTDLLAISFSATDFIGHTYGPGSPEMNAQLLNLDRVLAGFFKHLDESIGLSKVLVMLSADHGALPLVEDLKSRGLPAVRVRVTELNDKVKVALERRFKTSRMLAYSEAPVFWLDHAFIRQQGLSLTAVEDEISKALLRSGYVRKVYRKADLFKEEPKNDPHFSLYQNSMFASRSPDVIGSPKEYAYISDYAGGTGHGTPYDYDRHVPIIFMGANIKSGRYAQPCGPEDIAPTLAKILGLNFPKEDDARVLSEIILSENQKPSL